MIRTKAVLLKARYTITTSIYIIALLFNFLSENAAANTNGYPTAAESILLPNRPPDTIFPRSWDQLAAEQNPNEPPVKACLLVATEKYGLPLPLMFVVNFFEGGRTGEEVKTIDGYIFLGVLRINYKHVEEAAKIWHLSHDTAYKELRENPCAGADFVARKLKEFWKTDSYEDAVEHYGAYNRNDGKGYRKAISKMLKTANLKQHSVDKNTDGKPKNIWTFAEYFQGRLTGQVKQGLSLKECQKLSAKKARFDWKARYLCIEPKRGTMYEDGILVRKEFYPRMPREMQIGSEFTE